jgi:hypothetical protein
MFRESLEWLLRLDISYREAEVTLRKSLRLNQVLLNNYLEPYKLIMYQRAKSHDFHIEVIMILSFGFLSIFEYKFVYKGTLDALRH